MKHIAVAGNIGAGKTTLVKKLATHFDWDAHFESVEDNPYLADFYEDMKKWSFPLQIYFLHSRFNQVVNIRNRTRTTIQDRTIYEDAHIFAMNLHKSEMMETRDFENAWDEKVRKAAIALTLTRLEQAVKEPIPSAGFVHAVSGGR
ncbi:MAG: deoxynucleoside kinase, partial [Bacteroidia bacterium]